LPPINGYQGTGENARKRLGSGKTDARACGSNHKNSAEKKKKNSSNALVLRLEVTNLGEIEGCGERTGYRTESPGGTSCTIQKRPDNWGK